MGSTMDLDYTRFVRQVSNGRARSKYSYIAMQQDLLAALKTASWYEANCDIRAVSTVVNAVAKTDAKADEESGQIMSLPSYSIYLDDRYDAYKQGGDAIVSEGTMCGYAGMVAYRFKLPRNYASNITSVRLPFQASRYLRSGLRVALVLSNSSAPSNDWAVIRGENNGAIVTPHTAAEGVTGVASWGFMAQAEAPYLMLSRANDSEVVFDAENFPALGTTARFDYLWVYVSIEDYADYWDLYDNKTPRYYSIEGSATLVASAMSVTFAGVVEKSGRTWVSSGLAGSYPADIGYADNGGHFGNLTKSSLGNFVKAQCLSRMVTNFASTPAALKVAFGSAKTLAMSTCVDVTDIQDSRHATSWPLNEIGTLSGVPMAIRRSKGLFWRGELGTYTPSEDKAVDSWPSVGHVTIGYSAVVVNGPYASMFPRTTFNRFRFRRNTGDTLSDLYTTGQFSLLVWRSTSTDIMGPFAGAALAALASNKSFWTGDAGIIQGAMQGNGTETANLSVNAEADLIGVYSMPEIDADNDLVEFELQDSVRPGEVVIFVPRLDRSDSGASAAGRADVLTSCDSAHPNGSDYVNGFVPFVDFA